ncbi:hypothetical protein FLM06_18705 [Vibrio cholerae]|uniref:hypothetical protein n=2 Tax=Vibrio cholerae TaxID=666 RepID=UPI0011573F67|nr:hypothetical protein [Vibrio cholerae]TQO73620.1 hypothetical protein FLM06_18705 [Vibrio cholerae]TQP40162.1 hypothetical protein FLL99_19285 [Vibrio cholerae]TQQ57661.1 hypothetical protein FLL83_19245 [Vibrio cholerae]
MSKCKNSTFVSVVLLSDDLIYNKEQDILFSIQCGLMKNFYDYEIIILDHNNSSASQYNQRWSSVLKVVEAVRIIQTASHLDRELAYTIGIENSIGDSVVLFNPLRDPVEIIVDAININRSGADVVVGVSESVSATVTYKLIRPFINKLLFKIGYEIPRNATGYYVLSRNAANSITLSHGKRHKLFLRISKSALNFESIIYECTHSIRQEKKSVIKSIPDTLNIMVFNSIKPLRLMAVIGAFASLFSLIFATYSIIQKIFNDQLVDGWASIAVLISFQFMVLFIILSFLSEYIGRILDENNIGEQYAIVNELNSTVMVDENRINVLEESI